MFCKLFHAENIVQNMLRHVFLKVLIMVYQLVTTVILSFYVQIH